MGNTVTNFRLTLSLVQASGSIHLLQDHKGVYTSREHIFPHFQPSKNASSLPPCQRRCTSFTISCSWLAAAFFFSTYPAAFTTFTPCFRHRSRAIATYSSQDNYQEPHRFEQKQRQRQKSKATALADVTSFKVPTKD